MQLSTLIWITLVIVVLIVFWKSGKLRALTSALFNSCVDDLASTPEGAEALFNQKIEELEDKFRRADEVYKKIAGQRKRCENELAEYQRQLTDVEKSCETLAKNRDEEGLDIKIQQRGDIMDEISLRKEKLKALQDALRDAKEAREACELNLNEERKKKSQTISKMKHNRDMKEVYADLEGIGAGDHTSKMLDKAIEKAMELEDVVQGSKEAYETKSSTRARKLDQRLKSSENNDYKQSLLNKYK
jgi:phage shock protein A